MKSKIYRILRNEELETDSLGNYIDYDGIKDNLITIEDDLLVTQNKIFAQEEWLIKNGYASKDMLDFVEEYSMFKFPMKSEY